MVFKTTFNLRTPISVLIILSGCLLLTTLLSEIFGENQISVYKSQKYNLIKSSLKTKPQKCSEPHKFVYLKVHKAGSSTIKKILGRYAKTQNFNMTLTGRAYGAIGGYPAPFNATPHLLFDQPTDVIYSHHRHNKPEIMKVLSEPKTHKFIGSVREPYSHMLSTFNYYYYQHTRHNMQNSVDNAKTLLPFLTPCRFNPWLSVTDGNPNATFGEYLKKLNHKTTKNNHQLPLSQMPHHQKAINFQTEEFNNLPVDQIFQEFDFVFVIERMAESLIILRELLCAGADAFKSELDMVANQRVYEKPNFGVQEKAFIEKYIIDKDLELYKRANLELDRHVEKYGKAKLWDEVEKLRQKNLQKVNSRKRRTSKLANDDDDYVDFTRVYDEAVYQYRNAIKCGYGYNYDINDKSIKKMSTSTDGSNLKFLLRI